MAVQRYRVKERIAVGGMAEVYKGVATSLRGFEKIVAIKRVLPHLARNRTFVRMFLDEARLSLYLNHANVAQVFDVGHADDAYFIVMEYVEGIDLLDLMDVTSHNDLLLPYEQAVFIASQLCQGLAYAHDKSDPQGAPLNIVHRDISPPNVLLSMQGEVKIVDFGLAKARSQLETTDPGLVKGKFGYLSPEAAYGDPVDPRTDIFAVGILLWEMLAGRRLFSGENDQDTLELVRRAKVPPLSRFNPDVPEALEAIVSKALSRDKSLRYQRADELGRALSQFLFASGREVTSYDIAALVQACAQLTERGGLGPSPSNPEGSGAVEGARNPLDAFIDEELNLITFSDSELDREVDSVASGLGGGGLSFGELSGDTPGDGGGLGGGLEDPSDWFEEPLFDSSINMSLVQIVGAAKGQAPLSAAPPAEEDVEIDVDVDIDIDLPVEESEIDVDIDEPEPSSPASVATPEPQALASATQEPESSVPVEEVPRVTASPPRPTESSGDGGESRAGLIVGIAVAVTAVALALIFLL